MQAALLGAAASCWGQAQIKPRGGRLRLGWERPEEPPSTPPPKLEAGTK